MNFGLITVYLLLPVNKIMQGAEILMRHDECFGQSSKLSESALFCHNSQAQSKYAVII